MATLWPLSVAATVLSILGYAPEYRRLWTERRRSGAGLSLWLVWALSYGLALVNTVLNEASPVVVSNSAAVFGLTAATALVNVALPPASDGAATAFFVDVALPPPPSALAATPVADEEGEEIVALPGALQA